MNEPVFEKVTQIALVVRSIDEKIKIFNDIYGMGPWTIYNFNSDTVKNMTVHGEKIDHSHKVALYDFGNIELELIEPLDDKSIYSEFLKEKGEGLHHLGYKVKNYKKALDFLKKRGMSVTQDGWWFGEGYYAYLDSEKELGHIVEVDNSEDTPDFAPKPDEKYPSE